MKTSIPVLGPLQAPAWHRPWFRYFAPVDGAEAGTPAPDAPSAPAPVPTPPATTGAKPDEPLGAPGLAALQSERDARKVAEKATADALAKVKEFEDKDKTEQQRADEALTKAKADLAELTVAKTRAEVAAAKGVPVALLTGATQADIEASADALLQFKGTTTEPQKQRYVVPEEGGKPDLGKTESTRPGIGTLRAAYAESEGK
jgi:hypothetical protein